MPFTLLPRMRERGIDRGHRGEQARDPPRAEAHRPEEPASQQLRCSPFIILARALVQSLRLLEKLTRMVLQTRSHHARASEHVIYKKRKRDQV